MVLWGNETTRLGIFFAIEKKILDAFKHRASKAKTENLFCYDQ